MAVTADRNVGFAGQVVTADWAVIAGRSARYSLMGGNDLRVTVTSGDRSVLVAAAPSGVWGDGVLSFFNTSTTLQANSVASGSRWDTVVVRRNWGNSTAQLMVLQGGTTKAVAASRTKDPGLTTSDQPIALIRVQAGMTAVQEVVDLRCWAGAGGGVVALDEAALGYLDDIGTVVRIGNSWWIRSRNSAGNPVWQEDKHPAPPAAPPPPNLQYRGRSGITYLQSGFTLVTTDNFGVGRVNFPSAFPNGVLAVNVNNASGDAATNLIFELQARGFSTTRQSFWYRVKRANTGFELADYTHRIYWIATGW